MYFKTLFVISFIILSNAENYRASLRNIWDKDSDSVIDVTSASIVIKPSSFDQYSRETKLPYAYRRYSFKPRAIPINEEPQIERNNFYSNLNKTQVLFPGNYISIANEKSDSDRQFHSKAIPLIRTDEYQRRSLDVDEPIIEKPEGFSEATASRRSISDMFSIDGDDEDDYNEYEEEDTKDEERKKGILKKRKVKKLKKYMLPLLLAYKLKYFALVPVLISGMILLIGVTGLAGFFFALFAAVMGLQKGGY